MYVFNNFIWIHFLSYIQLKIIALKLVRAITAHIRKESKMVENVAKLSTKYNGIISLIRETSHKSGPPTWCIFSNYWWNVKGIMCALIHHLSLGFGLKHRIIRVERTSKPQC